MKNIFSQTKDYVKQPKRNVFDLSFHNHGTYNFGYLYPVFCKETIPGDSFRIDPTFALRFLPTAFPVQTRVTANLHFFYVRNRNLWDNWKKFITHTDQVEFPYLDGSQKSIKTSGLSDYLGVPTTLIGGFGESEQFSAIRLMSTVSTNNGDVLVSWYLQQNRTSFDPQTLWNNPLSGNQDSLIHTTNMPTSDVTVPCVLYPNKSFSSGNAPNFDITVQLSGSQSYDVDTVARFIFATNIDGLYYSQFYVEATGVFDPSTLTVRYSFNDSLDVFDSAHPAGLTFASKSEFLNYMSGMLQGTDWRVAILQYGKNPVGSTDKLPFVPLYQPRDGRYSLVSVSFGLQSENVIDYSDLTNKVFDVSQSGSIRLSALPFRAYESIYNSFYRNDQNDPLMIDGKPEYDVYVPNRSDGSDSYDYKLYRRNWELDFLTSAVQSPQQGIAPLVGVSQSGDFTFVNKDDNGNIGYFTAKANVSSDGSSITGFQLSDRVTLQGLPTDPESATDVPDSVKRGTVYTLNQMALAGISINDFRNVNSLQRWLETNIRRGYKYRDQIKSHYGVDISEKILDMPEFIGGISKPVFSSQVNQTVETADDPLGSYAGQLSLITDSAHSISHYCDEHGFIIGILSITPVPNYSQLLPKHFLKYNYLDYYFPEFAHIGMQPIDYREVCPLQQFGVDPSGLNNTFGYQRPWYDYISSVDEVHGLFRTNLRNFVLNRQFDSLPKLNADFLQVDPEQLNDIFTVQDVEDKILGQIMFNVIAKRPIPKFGIPRLE